MESEPPKVYESLAKCFNFPESLLLLHTPSLELSSSIASALYQQKDGLTLLVDFTGNEIEEINRRFDTIKHEKVLDKTDTRNDLP